MSVDARRLGSRYELVGRLGSGVMGEVWSARDLSSGALVAAKLLHPQWAQNPQVVARFLQERTVLLDLVHPNIVRVLDLVAEGGVLAIVMEHVPGGTLAGFLHDRGTLAPASAVPLACAVLDALAFAHANGVLHRDVKPENVLLARADAPTGADVRLGDFGIARLSQDVTVHATGLLGTPAYMPPELFASGSFSAASDVYGCGVMLYELLAGRTPFAGSGTALQVGLQHVTTVVPVLDGLDPKLWRVVSGMLAKDPHERLPADRVARALRELPAEAVAGPALPVQPQPASWETLPSAAQDLFGQAVHVRVEPGDAGATILADAEPVPQAPTLEEGPAQAVAAIRPEVCEQAGVEQATMLGELPAAPARAWLTPQAADPAPDKPRRWLWPVVAGVAVLIVVAVVLAATGVFRQDGPTQPAESSHPSWAPAQAVGPDYPTGLEVWLDAAASGSGVGLTVTLKAPRSTGLSGDLLIAFPTDGAKDGPDACPEVTSSDATLTGLTVSRDGVAVPCAYRMPVTLSANERARVQIHVDGTGPDSLDGWLSDLLDATDRALAQVVGDDFALQRVQGLQVQVGDVELSGMAAPVPYSVIPVWPSTGAASPSPATGGESVLFREDTLDYQATDLLKELTGGAGLAGVDLRSCPQVLVTENRAVAQQPAPSCFLQVQIGELDSGQTGFAVTMRPS